MTEFGTVWFPLQYECNNRCSWCYAPSEITSSKEKRFENVKNSFDIKNPEKIKGKNVILFDDVLTSGATLNEAKKVLKKAGAKKIIFMVLAH